MIEILPRGQSGFALETNPVNFYSKNRNYFSSLIILYSYVRGHISPICRVNPGSFQMQPVPRGRWTAGFAFIMMKMQVPFQKYSYPHACLRGVAPREGQPLR